MEVSNCCGAEFYDLETKICKCCNEHSDAIEQDKPSIKVLEMPKVPNSGNNVKQCSICGENITTDPFGWDGGCNAQPINEGVCCYQCDINVVLPARLSEYGFSDKEINEVIQLKQKEAERWDTICMD